MDFSPCQKIVENISKVIVGKKQTIELLLVALITEGHVLLEDVPGVAKTLLAKCLAKSMGGTFNRIQFTPDLMPADITGFNVYDQHSASFSFRPGPGHHQRTACRRNQPHHTAYTVQPARMHGGASGNRRWRNPSTPKPLFCHGNTESHRS